MSNEIEKYGVNPKKQNPARSWCLTSFKIELFESIQDIKDFQRCSQIRYLIWGLETCPTTGKQHLQGYIELNKPQRMSWIKKELKDNSVHLEIRKGTREQAREYCKKENNYKEFGKWISGQGDRTDLHGVIDLLKEGKKLTEVMKLNPKTYCQYRNGLKDIAANYQKERAAEWRDVEVILITGPTGCGKTKEAMKEATFKIEGESLKWFDGYDEDECILIDEYNNDLKVTKLLNLLDGYKLRLDVKGSFTYAAWKKVYITTNLKLDELHEQAKPAHRDALFRRITTIKDMW